MRGKVAKVLRARAVVQHYANGGGFPSEKFIYKGLKKAYYAGTEKIS